MDDLQEIVEVMGDPPGKQAQRFQLLGPSELFLGPAGELVGDIAGIGFGIIDDFGNPGLRHRPHDSASQWDLDALEYLPFVLTLDSIGRSLHQNVAFPQIDDAVFEPHDFSHPVCDRPEQVGEVLGLQECQDERIDAPEVIFRREAAAAAANSAGLIPVANRSESCCTFPLFST